MKETAKERQQMCGRSLSDQDVMELELALRQARRDLCMEGEINAQTRSHLDGVGVDYSALEADMDGDAPDRFDPSESLDWKWKPRPKRAQAYHRASQKPRFGDRVRRECSDVLGTVCDWKYLGRGYRVRVEWDGGTKTAVKMSKLVLISAFHCDVVVAIAHPKKMSMRARVIVRVDDGPRASAVLTLPPAEVADDFEAYVEALDEGIAPLLPAFGNDRDALRLRASSILRACLSTFDESRRRSFDIDAFAFCVDGTLRDLPVPSVAQMPGRHW